MRIVIDMQGAQTGSRFRGIGRYTLSLTKAMVRNRGKHDVILALSGLFPDTIEPIRAEFSGLLPREDIRVWRSLGPTREVDSANQWRREVAERIREAFLASLSPDVVLITSLFEGFTDDAVGSIGVLNDVPTAVILYDLIPLISPDAHFKSSKIHQDWYSRKIASLKRSQKLLAISESARQEALGKLDFDEDVVVNISGACDQAFRVLSLTDKARKEVWDKLSISRPFVMYTGGSDATKNLERLIMAYAQLAVSVRQCYQLVLVGPIPEDRVHDISETASKSGLSEDEILFTGYIENDDLICLYNTCALFVFPSLHEGFGLPPLEAMACGAPVIGANATSLPEVIGLSSALFDPTSVASISAKIKEALTDKAFRSLLLAHGRTQFRTFSWDESAKRALTALQDFDRGDAGRISPLLSIEKTSIFKRRYLKILAIKLDHMGDFILAIAALAKLRARYPYASIDLIVGSWNAPIARELKLFDKIYTYDFFKKKSSEPPSTTADLLDTLLKSLGKYDIAIDLRRQSESRFLLTKTSADLKIGYETFDAEIDAQLDIAIRTYPDIQYKTTPLNRTSIARQMVKLVDALPDDINDYIYLPELSQKKNCVQNNIAVFPLAGSAAREWERTNFIELVDLLVSDPLIGNINIYFANAYEVSDFAFKPSEKLNVNVGLDFAGLTRSLSSNIVCVANNSGGAHLASYLGVTVIGVYSGHELPSEWAPQFNDSYVIHRAAYCGPCHGGKRSDCPNDLYCLRDISVADVYTKILQAINSRSKAAESSQNTLAPCISLQKNLDAVVKDLISSITPLVLREEGVSLVDIAAEISKNFPTYLSSPDFSMVFPGVAVDHRSTRIEWEGFSGSEAEFRWTDGNNASMNFEYSDEAPIGTIALLIDTLGRQDIIAKLNGIKIFDMTEEGRNLDLTARVSNLRHGSNILEFELPGARSPGNGDRRKLAIAVRRFRIDA